MITDATYITTSIPYVNAAPHLGHALEFVQADVLARHRRLRGRPVRLLSGTDDNAFKNVTAARAAGLDTATFVRQHAAEFAELAGVLDLSLDDFIQTSSDPRHRPAVERLWRRSAARGDFYRHHYTGFYCEGCEQFYAGAELVDGTCPEHRKPLERVTEENWFFRLTAYATEIEQAIRSGQVRIEPAEKRHEVLALISSGLHDFSVSRPLARAGGWGIPVPEDPGQVVYVWWDALANYVSALGYGADGSGDDFRQWWLESAERIHVVGKGITRFHAVYWLGLLRSAGLPLPTAIFVHEYLTQDGKKISKSAGVSVDPADLVRAYGADAVRWWLVSDVARVGDTDFTTERLVRRYHQDLAGGVGNLVSRTRRLVTLSGVSSGELDTAEPDPAVVSVLAALPAAVDAALEAFDFRAACAALLEAVATANRYVEEHRPWEQVTDPSVRPVLATLRAACTAVTTELQPFLPAGAARLASPGVRPFPRLPG